VKAGPFSEELWDQIAPIYGAILDHPFLLGLADGSLKREPFRFYVIQDAHFLREYARALSLAAARAPGEPEIAMFNRHAVEAIEAERSLHESFSAEFDLTAEDVAATPPAPTNLAYMSYLLASAYGGSFAEGLGALLPCYWIYWRVGEELARRGSPDPLYARWIETYGSEEFAAVARDVIDLADRTGPSLGEADRALMTERFVATSRYEWMFWDMGWRQEEWPVA
jgi:thiaminase (transcriptional activator TenA)